MRMALENRDNRNYGHRSRLNKNNTTKPLEVGNRYIRNHPCHKNLREIERSRERTPPPQRRKYCREEKQRNHQKQVKSFSGEFLQPSAGMPHAEHKSEEIGRATCRERDRVPQD